MSCIQITWAALSGLINPKGTPSIIVNILVYRISTKIVQLIFSSPECYRLRRKHNHKSFPNIMLKIKMLRLGKQLDHKLKILFQYIHTHIILSDALIPLRK